MIVSVYGTGKKNTDAAASHGFVQLYNSTDRDIRLAGAALYYRKDSGGYTELLFPEDAVIPAGGYYLVRAASPKGYNTAGALINVLYADLDWNVFIDNKEVHLVLAPSGWDIYPTEDITALTDAVSVFVSSEKETYASVFAVNSLSKKKVAVRTAYRELQRLPHREPDTDGNAGAATHQPPHRGRADQSRNLQFPGGHLLPYGRHIPRHGGADFDSAERIHRLLHAGRQRSPHQCYGAGI
ncbi:MAG: lamin tail domain-containing protein [Oscillospiraceae bacterium]|nr:MAG: lamin tail domain-containing protein [Oscillospiraceae bacterium]